MSHYPCERCGATINASADYEHECEDLARISVLEHQLDAIEEVLRILVVAELGRASDRQLKEWLENLE